MTSRRPASVHARGLLLRALASLFLAAAGGVVGARAQEASWPSSNSTNPQAGTTRKFDDYGKVGHCDETARLDSFAATVQAEPGVKAYLMVYFGRNDMPAWKEAILNRAADYLVTSRGMSPERVRVVGAGYREERTTELWVVAEDGAPPEPTDTIEVKLDKTKAYQWNEKTVDIAFTADPEPEESEGAESEEEEAEAAQAGTPESAAGGETAAGTAADAAPAAEDESEEQWRKDVEKYEIAVVERGVLEDEPEDEAAAVGPGKAAAGGEAAEAAEGEAASEPEQPPVEGEVKISLWWSVERLAEELKDAPGAQLCLVYYYGAKNPTREKMQELIRQALDKTEQQLGVKRERVIVIDGGRGEAGVELWVVPRGAEPPKPRPGKARDFGFYSAPGAE